MIYLDNAATTFPKPEPVYQAVDFAQRNYAVNVGRGSYQLASEAMQVVDSARFRLAKLAHIEEPNRVIFTPSATIAANEVIFGLAWDQFKNVYVTPFEHNAIARPLHMICQQYGIQLHQLPFDSKTHKFDSARAKIMFASAPPDYIFANHISNVTGTIVPVREIFSLGKLYGATTIADCSQSLGLLEINMAQDEVDYLIFAGHKNLYASLGIGGFICRNTPGLNAHIMGGTGSDSLNLSMGDVIPTMYEPASPNIIAIASLDRSLEWLEQTGIDNIALKKKHLVSQLVDGLSSCDCKLYLPQDLNEHSGVVSFNVEGYQSADVGDILSHEFDIAVRTGFHCAPFIHGFMNTASFGGTVRASVGYFNTEADITALIDAVCDL